MMIQDMIQKWELEVSYLEFLLHENPEDEKTMERLEKAKLIHQMLLEYTQQ